MNELLDKLNQTADSAIPAAPSTSEVALDAQSVQDAARSSLDFLAALATPLVFVFCFPVILKGVWNWLCTYAQKSRDFSQLALGLPRGFGKTTLIKLFILYCILFTKKRFILIICARADLAENILADVVDMLNEPNIKNVFGDWKLGIEKDTQAVKKFGYRGRNIILAALGSGTSMRGLNVKNERPDVMIFDDIQTRECADSQVQSEALERWMIGTAMKAKAPTGCLFIFIANMYPTKWSLLKRLKNNPAWIKFIAGGILADGTSLWEELQPLEQLLKEFENDLASGHPEIFYSEVLNDETAAANNLIDISKLPPYPFADDDISTGNFIIIDPATDKSGADDVSIGYFEVYNATPVCRKLITGRLSPGDTIREALKLCLTHNCRLVAIESNAYQYSLNYWFAFICQQIGISGIEAAPIYSGSASKISRILTMFKALLAGEIYVHPDAWVETALQVTQFNPMRKDNTDGILDLLTYAPRVMEEFAEFIVSNNVIESQEFSALEVLDNNCSF